MPDVICCGEALVDRLGPPGGDPADGGEDYLGGAPANVCCGLARLGTSTGFLGRLGRDGIGAAFARLFQERGVDQQGLQWDEHRPSRIVLVQRQHNGERSFGGFLGDTGAGFADTAFAKDRIPPSLFQSARWLLFGTIPLASPTAAAALERAMALAEARQVRLVLDVNWRPTFWRCDESMARQRIAPLLERVHLLKLAVEEAEWLLGQRDPRAIGLALPQQPAVVVTAGGDGVAWWMGGCHGQRPAYPVSVVDSTGAGDAFLAGLLHQLTQQPRLLHQPPGAAVARAMAFASACGAMVCAGAGAINPQPWPAAVAAFSGFSG
ncbi:MAG: carbohydrate kinase [Cyanobacteria bacterium MAG IRC1_bin_28]|nr:carbohydrate kinase [Cyanobacteria bacterium MAG IRC1_bin_28]